MSKSTPRTFWEALPALDRPRPASTPLFEYNPAQAELEAQAILARARDEASDIVGDAAAMAQAMVAAASKEAALLRQQAIDQGAAEAYERAREQVKQELQQEFDEKVTSLQADVKILIDSICDQRKVLWEQTESEVLSFVIEMAKRVVKVEVQQNPKVIGEMIRHALRRVADKDNIRIRVCPDELEGIRADRKELLLVLDGARQLEIVDDRRIGRGGCVIETAAGTIDARIDTQFEQIADKVGVLGIGGDSE